MGTKPIAVFDLDGTFVRSSLLIEIVRGLIREGVFPPLAARELEALHRAWQERKGTYQDYIMKVIEVFYRRIRGQQVHDVEEVGRIVAAEQRDQVYVYTRSLIERCRATHHLVAITGSPDAVANPFAKLWGFARVYASNLGAAGGEYTGERDPPMKVAVDISDFKRGLLRRALEELDATMAGSVGIGDTESDIAFLETVAEPIAFNANIHLARIALARRWNMVYERKDTIVHLRGNGVYSIEGI